VLTESTVRQLMSGELPQLGSYGGAIGEFLSSDATTGAGAGPSARTAPHVVAGLSRVEQTVPCPFEPAVDALQAHFSSALVAWRVQNGRLFAACKFATGLMGRHPAIVEVLHDSRQAQLIAHAPDSQLRHGSASRALDRVAAVLLDVSGPRSAERGGGGI
jgi:hypothetical protein